MPWGTYVRLFRSCVIITVFCTVVACIIAPSMAQTPGASFGADQPSVSSIPRAPQRLTAQNLVVQGTDTNFMMLSKERYFCTPSTVFTTAGGTRIAISQVKPGQVVDIVYLAGGAKSEAFPFGPADKVLVSVRVVAASKQR